MNAASASRPTPTDEQQQVIEGVRDPESMMISAYAGCAKTTTLQMAAERWKAPALALAFNASIARELKDKFPGSFEVKTLNALGFGALRQARPQVKWQLEPKKLGKIVSQVARDAKAELDSAGWDSVRRLVSAAQANGLVPGGAGQPMCEDSPEAWAALADELWIDAEDQSQVIELARAALVENNRQTEAGVISFDDQIYTSTVLGGRWPAYPLVMVDEAQDLSPLNHRMLELCLGRPGAKLVAVGDPKQAIYQFRGADSRSMSNMRRLRPSWSDKPLRITFRCPKLVVARQQRHAPGFQAWSTNAEGKYARLDGDLDGQKGWSWEDLQRERSGHSLVVLCRNNGPLLSMAFKLIRRGVGVVMAGRDIGAGLVALSKKLAPDDATPARQFALLLLAWEEREKALALANGREEKVAAIVDRAECLRAVIDGTEPRDAGDIRRQLERLFSRTEGLVELSSIHKAKGKEWDTVLHLDPWRVPSRQARRRAAQGDETALEAEWNLKYVCETRTKHTLLEANLEDFR